MLRIGVLLSRTAAEGRLCPLPASGAQEKRLTALQFHIRGLRYTGRLFGWPLVDDALGFAERALQGVGGHGPDTGRDADRVFDIGDDPIGVLAAPPAAQAP